MEYYQKLQIAIIVIVIIILIFTYYKKPLTEQFLEGFWHVDKMSDPEFCNKCGADVITLYIGEPEYGWFGNVTRVCYLILGDIHQGFVMTYKTGYDDFKKYKIVANCEFDDIPIWPEDVTFVINVTDGKCIIKGPRTDGKKRILYAKLNKRCDFSNYVKEAANEVDSLTSD